MSTTAKRMIGESVQPQKSGPPLPMIQDTKPISFLRCPHCQQEIHEKHTYVEKGVDYHSDCGGPVEFPPASAEEKAYFEKHWGPLHKS